MISNVGFYVATNRIQALLRLLLADLKFLFLKIHRLLHRGELILRNIAALQGKLCALFLLLEEPVHEINVLDLELR